MTKSESGSETECEMHMGALMAVVEDATPADATKKDKMGWGDGMKNTNDRRLEAKSYIIHKHGGSAHHPSSAVAQQVLIQDVRLGELQAILIVRTKDRESLSCVPNLPAALKAPRRTSQACCRCLPSVARAYAPIAAPGTRQRRPTQLFLYSTPQSNGGC